MVSGEGVRGRPNSCEMCELLWMGGVGRRVVKPTKNNGHAEGSGAQLAGSRSSEVTEKPQRRRFTAEYKADILRKVDAFQLGSGDVGELLRKEGLYSSHLVSWRAQRERGALEGLEPKKRGRRALTHDPLAGEVGRLGRENANLLNRLKQAETIIEVQKKLCELLGLPLSKLDDENGRSA